MCAFPAEPRTRYDVVLVNAPPLLPVTDGVLLVGRSEGTSRSEGPA
jgi:Mrp family chromosome partitioning ATPase